MKLSGRILFVSLLVASTTVPGVPPLQAQEPLQGQETPTISTITAFADADAKTTTYSAFASYPSCPESDDCPSFTHTWSKTGQHCGSFGSSGDDEDPAAVWDYSTPDCPPPPHSQANIVVTATDGNFTCTASYPNGSLSGTGSPGTCTALPPHCGIAQGTLSIFPVGGEALVSPNGVNIEVFFGGSTMPASSCNGATLNNITTIDVQGSTGADGFSLDASQEQFQSSAGAPIVFDFYLSKGVDAFAIESGFGDDVFSVTGQGTGPMVMFNQAPLNFLGVESFQFDPGAGVNSLGFMGSPGIDTFELRSNNTDGSVRFDMIDFGTAFHFLPSAFGNTLAIDGGGGKGDALSVFDLFAADSPTSLTLGEEGQPVLLLPSDTLDESVIAELERLGTVGLLGGQGTLQVNGSEGDDTFDFHALDPTTSSVAIGPSDAKPIVTLNFNGFPLLDLNTGGGNDTTGMNLNLFNQPVEVIQAGGAGTDLFRAFLSTPRVVRLGVRFQFRRGLAQEQTAMGALNTDPSDETAEFLGSEIEKWVLVGSGGKNTISAAGGAGTGEAFDLPVTIDGKGGNDKLTGGDAADKLTGGPGTDSCNGGKAKDSYKTCEKVK